MNEDRIQGALSSTLTPFPTVPRPPFSLATSSQDPLSLCFSTSSCLGQDSLCDLRWFLLRLISLTFLLASGNCCRSVAQSRLTLRDPMDCSTPVFPALHHLPEFAHTHVHWGDDAIRPFHPLSPPSPPALNLSHRQCLFQWIGSLHQVAKVLELQLQHPSFHWIFRVDFL